MLGLVGRMLAACWRGGGGGGAVAAEETVQDRSDALLRYRDLGVTSAGAFSIAVVQANAVLEDESRVESTAALGTFVGVYDGHGGSDAARFVNQHLYGHLQRMVVAGEPLSEDLIRRAFLLTEQGFQSHVARTVRQRPQIAGTGCCALVGVLAPGGTLFVASLGDSRAVLGTASGEALELSQEHNASHQEVRAELQAQHPEDPDVVVFKNGVWRVKGIIQVSRSFGDFYLKLPDFATPEVLQARFRLPEPLRRPVLSAVPHIRRRDVQPQDRFVVFASDGLWEQLSNEQVVAMVQRHARHGIARRLVKAAMQTAARKREVRLTDLKNIERGVRRHFHDDITVVVLFLDHELISRKAANGEAVAV